MLVPLWPAPENSSRVEDLVNNSQVCELRSIYVNAVLDLVKLWGKMLPVAVEKIIFLLPIHCSEDQLSYNYKLAYMSIPLKIQVLSISELQRQTRCGVEESLSFGAHAL